MKSYVLNAEWLMERFLCSPLHLADASQTVEERRFHIFEEGDQIQILYIRNSSKVVFVTKPHWMLSGTMRTEMAP